MPPVRPVLTWSDVKFVIRSGLRDKGAYILAPPRSTSVLAGPSGEKNKQPQHDDQIQGISHISMTPFRSQGFPSSPERVEGLPASAVVPKKRWKLASAVEA